MISVKTRIIAFFALIMVTIVLASCCSDYFSKQSFFSNPDLIAAQGDSYSYLHRIATNTESTCSIAFSHFYGKETVLEIEGEVGTFWEIELDFEHSYGKYKLCLVEPNKRVKVLVRDTVRKKILIPLGMGEYKIVMVGIAADGLIRISHKKIYN